jgi:CRP-like cAMP-binding protein
MVRRHFLFEDLPEDALQTMVSSMRRHCFKSNDTIVGQSEEVNDDAPCMFFLQSGHVDLVVHGMCEEKQWQVAPVARPKPPLASTRTWTVDRRRCGRWGRRQFQAATTVASRQASGSLVALQSLAPLAGTEDARVVDSLGAGDSLACTSLVFRTPRAADGVARTDLVAWSLSRQDMLLANPPKLKTMDFLRAMPLLQKLTDNLLIIVAKACFGSGMSKSPGGQCALAPGEVVVRAGQPMRGLLLVMSGKLVQEGEGRSVRTAAGPYEFLGAQGILLGCVGRRRRLSPLPPLRHHGLESTCRRVWG